MAFITDHQLLLLTVTFSAGVVGTVLIARHPARARAWQVADLLWVVLGAIGAVAAVMAGVYKTDSTRVDHQIDVAYAATNAFDRDAARFRLRYCEGVRSDALHVLCDRVEFLSASTAGNAELPLFIQITKSAAPLQGLRLLPAKAEMAEMDDMDFDEMVAEANAFDPDPFLEFVALDSQTKGAMQTLRPARPEIAADYQVLANSYEILIAQVSKLKTEWEILQDNAGVLQFQIIAFCMVAFAVPFRLGKAIADLQRALRAGRQRDQARDIATMHGEDPS